MTSITKKEEKKIKIMDIAFDLFMEKGYKSVTTREITTAAGISKGMIYDYFKNKEDLFFQTVRQNIFKNIALKTIPKNANLSIEERKNIFKSACSDFSEVREKRFLMMFDFIINCPDSELKKDILTGIYSIIREFAEKILGNYYPEVYKDKIRSKLYTNMLICFVDGVHFQHLSKSDDSDPIKLFEEFWTLFDENLKNECKKLRSGNYEPVTVKEG